jgi:glycerol-3-phosphate O-acyltransferase
MTSTVELPLWLALLLAALAAWAALDRLLVPSVRWVLRRRLNRVLDELNTRLRIRVQPFKLTKRQVLIDRLLYDADVLAALEEHAREQKMPRDVAMARVRRYAEEIVPAFNAYVYFRLGYRLGRAVARSLYRVRMVTTDQEALSAVDPRSTIVFVMNHRSNMDYILVAYLAATATALSYAVGEWARIWPLQTLIRAMGAYFVRRRSNDPLYRRVLERYVHMATASGVTQAVYPEGGLSRDGRLRPPKLGLLDYMLRSFDPAGERDLVFVPVGINYDRVLEDRTLLRDLDPEAPRRGGLAAAGTTLAFVGRNLRQALTSRWYRFGYAGVGVGRPVSVRAWLAGRGAEGAPAEGAGGPRAGGAAALDLRRLAREERFVEVGRLADLLMDEIGRAIPAVPVAVAATVFVRRLAEDGGPISGLEAKARIFALQQELAARGALVYVPRGDAEYAAEVGLRMLTLRRLVDAHDGAYAARPAERAALAYYAHSIAHLLGEPAAEPAAGRNRPRPFD